MKKRRTQVDGIATISEAEMHVLRAVRNHINRHRISPTFDEVALAVKRSKSTVRHTISRLTKKKLISAAPGRFRNLFMTDAGLTVSHKKFTK